MVISTLLHGNINAFATSCLSIGYKGQNLISDNNNFYIHFRKVFVLLFLCLLPESLGAGLAVNYDASGCVAYALSRDVVFRI